MYSAGLCCQRQPDPLVEPVVIRMNHPCVVRGGSIVVLCNHQDDFIAVVAK